MEDEGRSKREEDERAAKKAKIKSKHRKLTAVPAVPSQTVPGASQTVPELMHIEKDEKDEMAMRALLAQRAVVADAAKVGSSSKRKKVRKVICFAAAAPSDVVSPGHQATTPSASAPHAQPPADATQVAPLISSGSSAKRPLLTSEDDLERMPSKRVRVDTSKEVPFMLGETSVLGAESIPLSVMVARKMVTPDDRKRFVVPLIEDVIENITHYNLQGAALSALFAEKLEDFLNEKREKCRVLQEENSKLEEGKTKIALDLLVSQNSLAEKVFELANMEVQLEKKKKEFEEKKKELTATKEELEEKKKELVATKEELNKYIHSQDKLTFQLVEAKFREKNLYEEIEKLEESHSAEMKNLRAIVAVLENEGLEDKDAVIETYKNSKQFIQDSMPSYHQGLKQAAIYFQEHHPGIDISFLPILPDSTESSS